ncbi:MAG: ABC transporter permease, partial [Gemmatimonadota bacterium]|nr:ABC transporter permease [Gemmatimonadota bacterium]
IESVVLSLLAAGLGALVAQAGISAFRAAIVDLPFPFWADIRLHPQLFVFIALAGLLASLVSGLLPAITAARGDITEVLKDQSFGSSSSRSGKLSRGLVVFELALSSALLIAAALTTKSLMNLRAIEPGFRSRDVMTGRITLSIRGNELQTAFFARLEQALAQLPGATAFSVSTNLPGIGWSEARVAVAGRAYVRPLDHPMVGHLAVTPGFFKTFDVAVTRGRPISPEDRAGALPVAVVNQRFVTENFPNADAIGRRIRLNPQDTLSAWVTIVGVMPTLFAFSPGLNSWPAEVITAFDQEWHGSASIAVRSSGDPAPLVQSLRALVATLDRDLPVYSLTSMSAAFDKSMSASRVFGGLFVVFGVVALALASIGLYAVLAFSVSRREREMGIRMALGAAATDVMRLVFKDAAVQLGLGVSLGLVLGMTGAQLGRAALFGVEPSDPATIVVVLATLALTSLVACIVPALRATKSDPVRSLRVE